MTTGRHFTGISRSSKTKSKGKQSADLITYRLGSEMVYVHPPSSFEEGLTYAQSVFPQLAHVTPERIAFSVNVRVGRELRAARIAPMAWDGVIRSLSPFEIVDVSVLPLSATSRAARSDSEIHAAKYNDRYGSSNGTLTQDPPPQYSSRQSYDVRDTDKSLSYTLQVPSPEAAGIKRSSSALGWFSRNR